LKGTELCDRSSWGNAGDLGSRYVWCEGFTQTVKQLVYCAM